MIIFSVMFGFLSLVCVSSIDFRSVVTIKFIHNNANIYVWLSCSSLRFKHILATLHFYFPPLKITIFDIFYTFVGFFLTTPCSTWKFRSQGLNLRCSCSLCLSCSNAGSLGHCAQPGFEWASQHSQDTADPLVPQWNCNPTLLKKENLKQNSKQTANQQSMSMSVVQGVLSAKEHYHLLGASLKGICSTS